jgi:hypothetical protein
MDGDYFSGTFRQTYQGQDPKDEHAPLFFLETAGFGMEPLMFHTKEGVWIRPASQMDGYDEGSVPHGPAQGVVSPNAWACTYALHDTGYVNHGWWEWQEGKWVFTLKRRYEVDNMMRRGMRATGCGVVEADLAYAFVREFGAGVWNRHAGPFPVGFLLQSEWPPADVLVARVPIWKQVGDALRKVVGKGV